MGRPWTGWVRSRSQCRPLGSRAPRSVSCPTSDASWRQIPAQATSEVPARAAVHGARLLTVLHSRQWSAELVTIRPPIVPTRASTARARAEALPVWATHAYGSLACRLACGQPPAYADVREHTCVYLRDPAPAGIDVERAYKAQKGCWCRNWTYETFDELSSSLGPLPSVKSASISAPPRFERHFPVPGREAQ